MYGNYVIPFAIEYAFIAFIRTNDGHHQSVCTGSVIGTDLVLTAAHCVIHDRSIVYPSHFFVRIYDQPPTFTEHKVMQFFIHPGYLLNGHDDMALIKTTTPLNVEPARLYLNRTEQKTIDQYGHDCFIAGFKRIAKLMEAAEAKNTRLTIVRNVVYYPSTDCALIMNFLDTRYLCQPFINGVGPCPGDSGGGLYCGHNDVIAVVSRISYSGIECGWNRNGTSLYKSVYRHRVWLERAIKMAAAYEASSSKLISTNNILIFSVICTIPILCY